MKALWAGLSGPGVWSTEPVPVDFQGMMSSLTKTWAETPGATTVSGFNLAVISETYMNLHLRLGYHFNLVDTRMEPEASRNHIYFRFVGGVTDLTRRSRRAQLLEKILSQFHFKVDTKGDLVVAKVLHLPREDMEQRLQVLGRLIGFTRQLDIQLRSDEDVPDFVEAFFDQNSRLREQPPEGGSHDGK
jgi:pyruvate,water dikinase